MRSKFLSGEELTGLRSLNDEAERLERSAGYLVQSLVNVFGRGHSVGGLPVMLIEQLEGPRIRGKITSRLGTARLVMAYHTNGPSVDANLIVERMIFDQHDREKWESVMSIQLPKPDWIMDGVLIRDEDRTFVLGASILHAIVNGPDDN